MNHMVTPQVKHDGFSGETIMFHQVLTIESLKKEKHGYELDFPFAFSR